MKCQIRDCGDDAKRIARVKQAPGKWQVLSHAAVCEAHQDRVAELLSLDSDECVQVIPLPALFAKIPNTIAESILAAVNVDATDAQINADHPLVGSRIASQARLIAGKLRR